MNATSQIQAVIFDLDGVITDTAEYHYQAWGMIAKELSLPFTREFNENLKGVSRIASLELLLGQATTLHTYSPEEMEEMANRKNEFYQQLIKQLTPADVLPGISELLAELKNHGVKTGIASASKNAFTVIRLLGMEKDFGVIVDAAKLARNKPDPEVFLTAADALDVDPQFCVGVEDAVAGVEAIKAAGMFAVYISLQESLSIADMNLNNTAELNYSELNQQFSNKNRVS
ncbi:beta-phosphoglucomutase [Paenibacillus sp. VTT E-133280]|uniref:beta-phosphoglucomutase n=1 Tax=unclassified Paenibacillus TaxID=185978 RepID=UPI000BA049B7|nr:MULTISPECIES: beta-phosphoglucomutase [unclassified Paenibacillus]MDH6373879.1 beta-phosphoglucomutase [Paenibacillus sp. PastF-3]OZQ66231.1 beta-phosphoglucomutase [Paenibacillus sp. VTT E-133280]